MQRNLWIVFLVLCVLFVFLIARLMYIEHTSGDRYEKIILAQQEYNSRVIPFQRGNIVDAKGTVLAGGLTFLMIYGTFRFIPDLIVCTGKHHGPV